MTDEATRAAERRWKASGDIADGQAWVEGELRAAGAPILPMISLLIASTRAFRAMVRGELGTRWGDADVAWRRRPTPEDMVAFLRGEGEWRRLSEPLQAVDTWRRCGNPECPGLGIPSSGPPSQAYCSLRCSELHRDALVASGSPWRCAVCGVHRSGPDTPAIVNLTTGVSYCSILCSDADTRRRCRAADCDAMVPADGAAYCSDSCASRDHG
jgi:hypothetical protein